ncbi:LacI family DNA-binding transcriptional regulator [Pseudonocardia sp. CA-107938]|uniref:LacI family DNA-binding transcriptional regulator n=1 Tax=Pseudonocardia sp. CA-107938 TaxID=3240021 RepID=UPI003D8AE242
MTGKRVTIRDVARSAGVSYQTVSRALNDKGEIDSGTKQRVLETARELGFRPSRFARGLVRQDTTSIGLVIPDLLNPFFTELASAALAAARLRGWHVLVYDTADDPDQELGTLRVIGSQVDAIVGYLAAPAAVVDQHTAGLPVVYVERDHSGPSFGAIRIDGEVGLRAAVAHLVEGGRRHIAMVDHDRPEPSARRKWFDAAMAEHGLTGRVVGAHQSFDGGREALDALLADGTALDAVIGYNDVIAIGALRRARALGRSVPDDLAVVGHDGLALGELVEPPLTTVRIDTRRLGGTAIDQAARLLAGEQPEVVTIPGELLLRGSA